LTALVGCSPNERAAEDAVKQLLNDPDSAKFTKVVVNPDGNVCGMVNAKNRMGGYVGETPFFYRAKVQLAAIVSPPEDSDFRSLWFAMKTRSDFKRAFSELWYKCSRASEWKEVCGTDYVPGVLPMCKDMLGGGKEFFGKMKAAYD
jgi:hypothetical protein